MVRGGWGVFEDANKYLRTVELNEPLPVFAIKCIGDFT